MRKLRLVAGTLGRDASLWNEINQRELSLNKSEGQVRAGGTPMQSPSMHESSSDVTLTSTTRRDPDESRSQSESGDQVHDDSLMKTPSLLVTDEPSRHPTALPLRLPGCGGR